MSAVTPFPDETAGLDAHWYAAEGIAAAVAHAMLVQPGREDVASAIERGDWPRAVAAAVECLRWIAVCHEMLAGRCSARTGVEVDLVIAGSRRAEPLEAMRTMVAGAAATRGDAERAADAAAAADTRLRAELPFRLPVRRTPTGHRPAAEVVSQLERLRHRLGLPLFDWEAWTG
ncbi:hypothetical protein [Spirillospora sp. NPDC047279]|uniref:hypothetical protein n=1 Tax=Spirillospora sp. NPDC047279 TaxID=3155478 RepID=UPI0033EA65DA